MAATQTMSPGGALLRASRMFAIPPPLPRPQSKLTSGSIFISETATLPYPTHLSITTPPSSLSRGDWGLKRPLPLRSTTRTSTPVLRVKTIDTYEHVTEFESAADHTLTLKKWQGLHLPLSTPPERINTANILHRSKAPGRRSVFEKDLDYTVPREPEPTKQDPRWKFNGPWLAGQTELKFNEYLKKEVRRRRNEFNNFLRQECARKLKAKAIEDWREKNDEGDEPQPFSPSDITDEQFSEFVKKLRSERVDLFTLIRRFLDLPPAPWSQPINDDIPQPGSSLNIPLEPTQSTQPSPYARGGPPKTHPSAGLSYLRTGAVIENHPLFGPQLSNTPVKSRVIMPTNAGVGSTTAKLGVAGVVTSIPTGLAGFNVSKLPGNKRDRFAPPDPVTPGFINVDVDTYGGTKVWVNITGASVNPRGMVKLETAAASDLSINIAEGNAWKAPKRNPATFYNRQRIDSGGGETGYRHVDTGLNESGIPNVFGRRDPERPPLEALNENLTR